MNIVVLTPVHLLGDSLSACFGQRAGLDVLAVVTDLAALRDTLAHEHVDLALIDVTEANDIPDEELFGPVLQVIRVRDFDVTHGRELYDIRALAVEHAAVALVALGVDEGGHDVIRCGRAGFSGYVSRDASVEALCQSLHDIVAGKLSCSAEISGSRFDAGPTFLSSCLTMS